jgi:hypothetical protein
MIWPWTALARSIASDLGFVGVVANAVVSQRAPVSDLTVEVSGPGVAYDALGRRIVFSALQTVNVAQDVNGVSTTVVSVGQERIVSVFLEFDRLLSDPRIDGHSNTVFFREDEHFKIFALQGTEAPAAAASTAPSQIQRVPEITDDTLLMNCSSGTRDHPGPKRA